MKIKYKGQELETITEGYWPEGVTLVYSDSGTGWKEVPLKVICLHNGRAFHVDGRTGPSWAHWAVLPSKQSPRRLTNREVSALCRKGWDACVCGTVSSTHEYSIHDEDKEAEDTSLRAPGSDEWVEPTSELLEVEK